MSSEDAIRRGAHAKIELTETDAAFSKLRGAMVSRLFATPTNATEERERLYLAVNTLDAVKSTLEQLVQGAADEKTIEEHVRALSAAEPKEQKNG